MKIKKHSHIIIMSLTLLLTLTPQGFSHNNDLVQNNGIQCITVMNESGEWDIYYKGMKKESAQQPDLQIKQAPPKKKGLFSNLNLSNVFSYTSSFVQMASVAFTLYQLFHGNTPENLASLDDLGPLDSVSQVGTTYPSYPPSYIRR